MMDQRLGRSVNQPCRGRALGRVLRFLAGKDRGALSLRAAVSSGSPRVEWLENRQLFAAGVPSVELSGASIPLATTLALGKPSVLSVSPSDGELDVDLDAFISTDVNVPNSGIDSATLTPNTVFLKRTSDNT